MSDAARWDDEFFNHESKLDVEPAATPRRI